MPLLYRILMRLAAIWVVGLGGIALAITIVNNAWATADWLTIGLFIGAPAALLVAVAWVIRPPLDRASLRRLWRE